MKKRLYEYDYIRVIAMIFVIAVHTSIKPMQENVLISKIEFSLLFTCNCIFYMMSGIFNLKQRFDTVKDILYFYKKRFVSIVIPYILGVFIILILTKFLNHIPITLNIFKEWIKFLLIEGHTAHTWFLYPLFGMILATPFISKVLINSDKATLKLILILILLMQFIKYNVLGLFNLPFDMDSWIFIDWMSYYVLGYIITKINFSIKVIIPIGIISFITNALLATYLQGYKNPYDVNALTLIYVICLFLILLRLFKKVQNPILNKIIVFVAKYSYYIYLFHWAFEKFVEKYIHGGRVFIFIMTIISTLILSMILSIVFEYMISPIINISKKILKI